MDKSWLLLFKTDVILQPPAVQQALFEQFVQALADAGPVSGLAPDVRREVLVSAFMEAAAADFHGRSAADIGLELRRLAERRVAAGTAGEPDASASETGPFARSGESGAGTGPGEGWSDADMRRAWAELSAKLGAKRRARSRLRQTGTVGLLACLLLFGGFLFGFTAPYEGGSSGMAAHRPATAPPPPPPPSAAGTETGGLTMLNLTERDIKLYTDFNMLVPGHLPPGYRLDEANVWLREGQTRGEHAMLTYVNEQEHLLRVSFYKLPKNGAISSGMFAPHSAEELFLRGSKAIMATTKDGFFKLDWLENETYISMSGRQLAQDEVIKLAESLK